MGTAHRRRERTGRTFRAQAVVEFALVAPILFLVLFGTIEVGRLVWTNHELANGVREGARFASVNGKLGGGPASNGAVKTIVTNRTAGLEPGRLTITATYADGDDSNSTSSDPGDTVTVRGTYAYRPVIALVLGTGTINMVKTSVVPVHH